MSEWKGRVERFQRLLRGQPVDGALIVQKVDLYYLSGTDQDAHLWVPAEGEALLMVRKSVDRARADAFLPRIIPLSSLSLLPDCIRGHQGRSPGRIGMELDVVPFNLFQAYAKTFASAELVDISHLIRQTRMVKTDFELSLMKRAAALADELLGVIPDLLKASETETDLALRAEDFYRRRGHPGLTRVRSFNIESIYGHILAGHSGAVPSASPGPTGGYGPGPFFSQGPGRGKIRPGEPVLVDYCANVEGYHADQTRIFVLGSLPDEMIRAHQAMQAVQDGMARAGVPGVRAGDLYELGLRIAGEAGISEGFMGHPQPVPFIGHGVGLELDEWPVIGRNSDHVLEEGMVIALEPKVVFPGKGAVGVENTLVVTGAGMTKLQQFQDDIVFIPIFP
ncbi:MAG: aminopeptidase P family protein [Deltaproteobacteria bacterium]|nr:aminopeptidase P family protein [Deltaproteobacteria bacterium]